MAKEEQDISEQLKNLSIGDQESWAHEIEIVNEYKIGFKNLPSTNTSAALCLLVCKNPKRQTIDEENIIDIEVTCPENGEGVLIVNDEISFAVVLNLNNARFKGKEIEFFSLESEDVTKRLKERIVVPELGEGDPYVISEFTNSESQLTIAIPKSAEESEQENSEASVLKPVKPEQQRTPQKKREPEESRPQPRNNSRPRPRQNMPRDQKYGGKTNIRGAHNQRGYRREGNRQVVNRGNVNSPRNSPSVIPNVRGKIQPCGKFDLLELSSANTSSEKKVSIFGVGKPREENENKDLEESNIRKLKNGYDKLMSESETNRNRKGNKK